MWVLFFRNVFSPEGAPKDDLLLDIISTLAGVTDLTMFLPAFSSMLQVFDLFRIYFELKADQNSNLGESFLGPIFRKRIFPRRRAKEPPKQKSNIPPGYIVFVFAAGGKPCCGDYIREDDSEPP